MARTGGLLLIWLLLLIFIVYPLLMLLSRAFIDDGHFTVGALITAVKSSSNLRALRNSLLLAGMVGLAGTLIGMIFAFTVERVSRGGWLTRFIDRATFLPLISPPFTTSIAIVFSFGPRGLITHDLFGLQNVQVYGLTSTFAAETLTYFPIAYLALRPMLASISNSFEEAAFSLGGSRWHAFRTVTLPLTVPGLANAFLLLFGCSLADFATPLILAGSDFPVLPTEAYLQITGHVRPQDRGDPVIAAFGAGRARLLSAGISGRGPLLRYRHRQGFGGIDPGLGVGARQISSAGFLPLHLRADPVFLCAAVLRIDRSGLRRK